MRSIRNHLKTWPYGWRLLCALLVLSILTGLGGILLHHVLEIVELLAFGHAEDTVPFLTDDTSWLRRGLVLVLMGIFSALVWYGLQRKQAILSIKGEMGSNSKQLYHVSYFARQLLHILWQIIAVGAGAYGGTLTPSFALGATAASLLGSFFPALMEESSAILLLGAVAFLAVTLRAPLSAVGLVIGFTGQSLQVLPYFLVTALLAYFWSIGLDNLYQKSRKKSSS